MDINQLNEIASNFFPTKKMMDLESGKKYNVTGLKRLNTKYGNKIVIIIDESYQVFLPERVSKHINDNLFFQLADKANKLQLYIHYLGYSRFEFV